MILRIHADFLLCLTTSKESACIDSIGVYPRGPLLFVGSRQLLRVTNFSMKIWMLLACSALAFLAAFATDIPQKQVRGGNGITLPPPPPTVSQPVTETVSGHALTDPYRWLEDQNSLETRSWIDAQ